MISNHAYSTPEARRVCKVGLWHDLLVLETPGWAWNHRSLRVAFVQRLQSTYYDTVWQHMDQIHADSAVTGSCARLAKQAKRET